MLLTDQYAGIDCEAKDIGHIICLYLAIVWWIKYRLTENVRNVFYYYDL